jgi:hypothetical protein
MDLGTREKREGRGEKLDIITPKNYRIVKEQQETTSRVHPPRWACSFNQEKKKGIMFKETLLIMEIASCIENRLQ